MHREIFIATQNADSPLEQAALNAYYRGDLAAAEKHYRRLLNSDSHNALLHNNLANVLRKTEQWTQAHAHYLQALEAAPAAAKIRNNLAGMFEELEQYDRAEAEYRHALALQPDFAEARFNLGLLLLSGGHYSQGWQYYEARAQLFREHGSLPFPQWQGEDVTGKTFWLLPEQGYGDTIQFVRYAALLKARGAAQISVLCNPPLAPLLSTAPGIDTLITRPEALKTHDYWDSLVSLPGRFNTLLESIPAPIPYLSVFAERVQTWGARLPKEGLRVGLVWQGNPEHGNDAQRSLRHFSELEPLWSIQGIRFVSLQMGPAEEQTETCEARQPIVRLGHEINDFGDTAAIVAQLNLVICVDTAVAHVAGALGIACWVMLPRRGADWRWLHIGSQSRWYPDGMYLFRQSKAGWPALIEEVKNALAELARQRYSQTQIN